MLRFFFVCVSYVKGHRVHVAREEPWTHISFHRKLTLISHTLPVYDNSQRYNLTITFINVLYKPRKRNEYRILKFFKSALKREQYLIDSR